MERIQKILAHGGIASRRAAEQLIRAGRVRVNGHVVTELGVKADERRDRIEAIRGWVREHDLTEWIGLQLQALDAESIVA